MKQYNSRTHWSKTVRHLAGAGALIIVLAALGFAALRLGDGAVIAATGMLAMVALMVGLAWGALKIIEWLGGHDD